MMTRTPRIIRPPCRVMTRLECCAMSGGNAPTAAEVPRHTAKVMAKPNRVRASPKKTSDMPQLAPNNTMAANVPAETAAYVDQSCGTVSRAITVGTTATPNTEKANQECSHCHFLFNFMGRE